MAFTNGHCYNINILPFPICPNFRKMNYEDFTQYLSFREFPGKFLIQTLRIELKPSPRAICYTVYKHHSNLSISQKLEARIGIEPTSGKLPASCSPLSYRALKLVALTGFAPAPTVASVFTLTAVLPVLVDFRVTTPIR